MQMSSQQTLETWAAALKIHKKIQKETTIERSGDSRSDTTEDSVRASSTITKSFIWLFQLVLWRPSSEPGMPSSEPDPLPVRVDNEDIREKRQRTKCPCVISWNNFCIRKYYIYSHFIREYFVKRFLAFSLSLVKSHKSSKLERKPSLVSAWIFY